MEPQHPPAIKVRPPDDLLHYQSTYAVLICTSCQYAIQPSGLARHLKEIHHVYRSRRRPYMEYASQFKLAPPEEVMRVGIKEFPVRRLPVLDGLRCLHPGGCGYLCVSIKRMQNHWSCAHGGRAKGDTGEWGPAPLQTFFRGNLLQYFTDPKSQQVQSVITSSIDQAAPFQFSRFDHDLLHHYVTSTALTLVDRHGTEDIWAVVVPQLASCSPFLMHAILACSALHLAHKLPSQRSAHLLSARTHQDAAMPLFRRAIAQVDRWNCNAVLVFSHLLVIYSFATDFHDSDDKLLLASPSDTRMDMMCSWLYFIRNGCVAVCDYWDMIESGPLAPLANSWESDIPGLRDDAPEPSLTEHLLFIAPSNEDSKDEHPGSHPWSERVREVYRDSATQLAWAFTAAQSLRGEDFTTWDAVRLWPMEISTEYIALLVQEHPAALILLAHYCLLLERLQPHWYFEGRVPQLLNAILERLDPRWHDCIQTSLTNADSLL
jgi:hypothetical protein